MVGRERHNDYHYYSCHLQTTSTLSFFYQIFSFLRVIDVFCSVISVLNMKQQSTTEMVICSVYILANLCVMLMGETIICVNFLSLGRKKINDCLLLHYRSVAFLFTTQPAIDFGMPQQSYRQHN